MRVYQSIGQTLRALGTDTIFGLMGDGNLRFITYMADALEMRYVGARHENIAVAMADGYARVGDGIGVCSVTQGPGLTNALTALTEAAKGRTPLLLVAGDTPIGLVGHNQDIDQDAVVGALKVASYRLRGPETAQADLRAAAQRALVESRPVVVSVPTNLQDVEIVQPEPVVRVLEPIKATLPDPSTVHKMAELVQKGRRPLIIAGRGAARAKARASLEALAVRIGAVLATTAPAKGLFQGNPYDLGIAGGFSTRLGAELMAEADLVLVFGASLNHWTTRAGRLLSETAVIVHCDVNQAAIGAVTPIQLGVVGDANATARALLEELTDRGVAQLGFRTPPVERTISGYSLRSEIAETAHRSADDRADPRWLLLTLDELLPSERTVVIDSGHFMGFPSTYLNVPDPTGWVFAQDFQSVGLGLGNAIGAATARPDRTTVLVIGDGGMMMTLGDLDTAVRYAVPLLVVIMNDGAYGAEVHALDSLGLPVTQAFLGDPDFAAVAAALGAVGVTVREPHGLHQIRPWLAAPHGPLIVDCKVDVRVRGEWLQEAFGAHGWLRARIEPNRRNGTDR